jgi:hypothetical protein
MDGLVISIHDSVIFHQLDWMDGFSIFIHPFNWMDAFSFSFIHSFMHSWDGYIFHIHIHGMDAFSFSFIH